jgi:hypothetical protein
MSSTPISPIKIALFCIFVAGVFQQRFLRLESEPGPSVAIPILRLRAGESKGSPFEGSLPLNCITMSKSRRGLPSAASNLDMDLQGSAGCWTGGCGGGGGGGVGGGSLLDILSSRKVKEESSCLGARRAWI